MDDVGYFRKIIGILKKDYQISEDEIFVTGWSNGGFMSFRLACELSDLIAAAAPFVGTFGIRDINSCWSSKLRSKQPPYLSSLLRSNITQYEFNKEACPYETWRDELPHLYQCNQSKEIPILNIMGK